MLNRGVKSALSVSSHGFVLLSVLFLEHDPLETLQPTIRLLAVAVIEKDLLFVFKPFEVVTSYVYIYICTMPFLMVFFLLTGQGLILCFLFLFFFSFQIRNLFIFEGCFLAFSILLLSHTSFRPFLGPSLMYVCYMLPASYILLLRFNSPNKVLTALWITLFFFFLKCKSCAFILNLFSDLQPS